MFMEWLFYLDLVLVLKILTIIKFMRITFEY